MARASSNLALREAYPAVWPPFTPSRSFILSSGEGWVCQKPGPLRLDTADMRERTLVSPAGSYPAEAAMITARLSAAVSALRE
ncbi:MAG: hypothetical protein BWX47_01203 [candidate division Hyd24-12 bacterium ADurb.Bin004]|nr:MAG: hypothetical protein BWX47_01203 [candidate division Hyd24-12 bacterium ADurb.Bin004]